jgi:DNA-binding NarL/FixJ family response regulator
MPAQFRRQASPPHEPPPFAPVAPASTSGGLVSRVLILNSNRLVGELLAQTLRAVFVTVTTTLVASLAGVDNALATEPADLVITEISASDGDACDRIPSWSAANRRGGRTLVVTTHKEPVVLLTLANLPISGVFDVANEGLDDFGAACASVVQGESYWSPTIRNVMSDYDQQYGEVYRLLSPNERMVLGVIGDGCDDVDAAKTLPFTPATIRTIRGRLHRKLNLRHKGELIACAAAHGFVIRTSYGVQRPGLADLVAAYHRHARPRAALRILELPLLAAHGESKRHCM